MADSPVHSLANLPPEVLSMIIDNLGDIQDFTNLSSTCSIFQSLSLSVSSSRIWELADAAPELFAPHPWHLTAMTVKSAICRGVPSEQEIRDLIWALEGGIAGIYKHCLKHGRLDLPKIRRWHAARTHTINPFEDALAGMADQHCDPSGKPLVHWNSPTETAYQIIIYAELFETTMSTLLQPELQLPSFDLRVRLKYLTWTLAKPVAEYGGEPMWHPPTVPFEAYELNGRKFSISEPSRLLETVENSRWEALWHPLIHKAGGYFTTYDPKPAQPNLTLRADEFVTAPIQIWKNRVLWSAVMLIGGLDAIARAMKVSQGQELSERDTAVLRHTRECVESLDDAAQDTERTCWTWEDEEIWYPMKSVPHMGYELQAAQEFEIDSVYWQPF